MKIHSFLNYANKTLLDNSIQSARLDSLIILEYVLNKDRAWILANPNFEIDQKYLNRLNKILVQRKNHTPIAYITKNVEFYWNNFLLNNKVLIPRPETEDMIDLFINYVLNDIKLIENVKIADIGTGCGAIGISLKLLYKDLYIDLVDIDMDAIKIAKFNVDKFTLTMNVLKSNLLSNVINNYHVLLCNLPYIPDKLVINDEAHYEPKKAIFGGKDGLGVYRKLFKQINKLEMKPLFLLLESLKFQHKDLKYLAAISDYYLVKTKNLIQLFKYGN